MIRTMLDSDHLPALGQLTPIIATYSDLVHDRAAFEAQHPGQIVVYIDRGLGDPDDKATVADAERGALRVGQLPAWYDRKHKAGLRFLTAYCSRVLLPQVISVMGHRSVWHWVARLDGTLYVPTYSPLRAPAVVQIAGAAMTGIHADFSLVYEDGWHPQH